MSRINANMHAKLALTLALVVLSLSGCDSPVSGSSEESRQESRTEGHESENSHAHKIVVTTPLKKDVIDTQPFVCQIHSCKHIEVRALKGGYLQEIRVKEGQAVKKDEVMFQILPVLYKARLDSEVAEANRIEIELNNARRLNQKGIVSPQEIALKEAELAKAQASVMLARAELNFASVKAPFDGIVDRQRNQLGSLVNEGDVLTTLSDNSVMWVYFPVPEARYLEYQSELNKDGGRAENLQIELKLANGKIFPHRGKIGAVEADFNNTTGNILFRADFPNPDGLLRNGQTGTVLIHRIVKDVVVIPQRATFEILDKRYAYVVDEDGAVHQRYIQVQGEQDDIFVIQDGLDVGDKIILEGIRQVRDGDTIDYEFRPPEDVLAHLKYHAE